MPSTHKHIRSSTANKRPTTAIADGQIALNTNSTSPGLFFKDSTGATIIKLGPVHVGATAPNVSPAAGGSSGNSTGEVWLDTSLTPNGVKIWNGSSWTNATPIGSTTVQGLLELATSAETQAGSDTDRAVTPAGLQSKVSDSVSTTSSTTIASSTAVKAAYDLAAAAVPLSGGTVTGNLEIGTTGSLSFEGSTADGFETTLAVTDPTADRTITLPNVSGTVVTTGDTGTVTSTMIVNDTIVDADVNASAAIAGTKVSPNFGSQTITTTGVVSAAAGAAATPSITFTGDLNTGIYSPGADQLAISTNGTGRLFVDSSGRLLVGTSTSVSQFGGQPYLQVSGLFGAASSIGLTNFNVLADSAPSLTIGHSKGATVGTYTASVANDLMGEVSFTAGNGTDMRRGASIGGYADGAWGTNDHPGRIVFSTTADGASTPTERLRITSDGKVGLGTSSPKSGLHVVNDVTNNVNSFYSSNLYYDGSWKFIANGVGGALKLADAAGYISFLTANAVNSSGADAAATVGTRMVITPGGNVGIGTSSPAGRLDVRGGTIEFDPLGGADSTRAFNFNIDGNNFAKLLVPSGSGGALAVYTGGIGAVSERARIDSSGRLLVGTSSARAPLSTLGSPLQVEGTSINSAGISVTRSSNDTDGPSIWIAKNRGGLGANATVVDGDELGSINFTGNNGSNQIQGASIRAFADGAVSGGGAGDLPGRLVFSTTADGASSPTERMRIANDGRHTINSNAHQGTALSTTAPANLYTSTGTYTDTSTAASGTVTHGTIVAFDNPAIAASNLTVTYTNASTVYIDGAPTAGTNVTVTNPYALYVNAGTSFFGGNVNLSTGNEYRINNTKVVGARVTGWTAATGTATRTTFATSTVTTAQLAERVKALIDDLISHGLIGT